MKCQSHRPLTRQTPSHKAIYKTLGASLIALGLSCTAQADTIFGIYAGGGSWSADMEGNIGKPSASLSDLGTKERNNTYYYIALEHPIPLIPNVKLQYNDISSSQRGSADFTLGNTNFTGNVNTTIDLSSTDATFYYELLDNWLNLDVGITVRKYDGELSASSDTASKKVSVDTPLPLLYGKFRFDLPFSGLSANVEGNYVSYKDSSISDYNASLSYTFESLLDLGFEVGYRQLSVQLDDDDIQTDVKLKGPYAALLFHF